MAYCRKCGLQISDDALFCRKCGTAVITKSIIKIPEKEKPSENDIDIEMILVEGGNFEMGSNTGDNSEEPVHTVKIDNFYMGKYLITQKLWETIMGNNPSLFKGEYLPVELVNWYDVQEFITKLNQKTGKRYRLPTEAEWEFAARGGIQNLDYKYSGSNNVNDVAWYRGNCEEEGTLPVGEKTANRLGLYDMSGNVWEWCNDWYSENYYENSSQNNPEGPNTGTLRVIRGGGWPSAAVVCRVSDRFYCNPNCQLPRNSAI